ncbi:MAG TPA: TRAP transporter substrate-binding protein [Burkholderiaceae bacterium]|nr:TRAP transporter substrate-binding protein [Burkholderiaceae bacterium]HQR69585.1 TRAP transporter substrate-binding protein [Burkholderiaceae bacterium]
MLNRVRIACAWLLAAASLAAAAQAPVTLKVHHFLPPGSTTHAKMIVPWCAKIEAESKGRLKCQIYPSMQLGGTAPQLYDQVRDGVVDVIWTLPGYNAGRFPAMEVFELPFMIADAQSASRAAWQFYERHGREEFRDVKPLAVHVHDAGYLHTRDRPVRTLEDLRGMKLRAPTRQTNRLLAALGATPVSMPVTGLADAMSKGVLDGAMVPWEVVPAVKIQEVARFHTETDPNAPALYTAVFLFAMNTKTYAGLPDDLKAVIDRNSGVELSAQAGRLWDEQKAPARKLATDRGNTVFVVPAAELARWQVAAQPVITDWIADVGRRQIDGNALLDDARALLARSAPEPRPPAARREPGSK